MTIDKKEREVLMDKLLIFMNDEVEKSGCTTGSVIFRLHEDGEDAINFMGLTGTPYEKLVQVLNTCVSRQYVRGFHHDSLRLTEEGQGRAISAEQAKHSPSPQQSSGHIHIGELHAHGATQIGNHNTQNIENVFTSIIEQIEKSDAPEAEKQEVKNRLKAFLKHPLTGTLIGLAPKTIKALCGGG